MLKRLAFMAVALFALCGSAFAAGTIPLSLSQQLDNLGKPLSGCKLYLYQAGTVATPQNAYQDTALTQVLPNPLICDAYGRLSQFFLADGNIKVRLTNSSGVTIYTADNILVIGPSSGGGGGGGTVDPTTIMQTGHMELFYGSGVLTGFVRCNGRTIGSAVSGASERANADTSALFAYLWGADPNLTVAGGRGANAAADFAANKTLTLPDCRGRVIAGLADMGNTAASWLTSTYFGATPTTLGAVSTTTDHTTLVTGNLPPYTPSGTVTLSLSGAGPVQGTYPGTQIGTAFAYGTNTSVLASIPLTITGSASFSGIGNGGSSTPFSSLPPTILTTIYIKL